MPGSARFRLLPPVPAMTWAAINRSGKAWASEKLDFLKNAFYGRLRSPGGHGEQPCPFISL